MLLSVGKLSWDIIYVQLCLVLEDAVIVHGYWLFRQGFMVFVHLRRVWSLGLLEVCMWECLPFSSSVSQLIIPN